MKPKWWNIDWVELGCRGWDINVIGAGLGEDGEIGWQYAHLDRDTLDLIIHGRPAFFARVITDFLAARVINYVETNDTVQWNLDFLSGSSTSSHGLTTATSSTGSHIRLVA